MRAGPRRAGRWRAGTARRSGPGRGAPPGSHPTAPDRHVGVTGVARCCGDPGTGRNRHSQPRPYQPDRRVLHRAVTDHRLGEIIGRETDFLSERWERLLDDRQQGRKSATEYAAACIDMRTAQVLVSAVSARRSRADHPVLCRREHPVSWMGPAPGGYLRTGPGQCPSLSVIRSQDHCTCRLCVPRQVQTCGYRSQSLSSSSGCLINGRVVTCSCWSRSAVLS